MVNYCIVYGESLICCHVCKLQVIKMIVCHQLAAAGGRTSPPSDITGQRHTGRLNISITESYINNHAAAALNAWDCQKH